MRSDAPSLFICTSNMVELDEIFIGQDRNIKLGGKKKVCGNRIRWPVPNRYSVLDNQETVQAI